jgi:hypothetical protein
VASIRETGVAFVEAPTALAGFLLVTRLPDSRSQNKQDAQGRWIVRVPLSDAAAVRTLIERVQVWMRQERIAKTKVSVGADTYCVAVDRADLETPTEGGQ